MGLGAIVVVGAECETFYSSAPQDRERQDREQEALLAGPIECVEILGRSMVERVVERFARADLQSITVLVPAYYKAPAFTAVFKNVKVEAVDDVSSAITQQLKSYAQEGIEHSFLISGNVYTETDLLDLFYFHREARQAATRAVDKDGSLNLWVVDCAKAQQDLETLLTGSDEVGTRYFVRDYVRRLADPRDLRQLVSDSLCGRCAMRPSGREIKPGIWAEDGAEIHRRARIVAPAFIGDGSTVEEDTLITRCSSIERGCYVDCGTVIEDSSVLANTHIGIWLDVCHAVASGNKLLSFGHNVLVEISDTTVMRHDGAVESNLNLKHQFLQRRAVAEEHQQQAPAPQACGLEPILSRGD